MNSTHYCYPEIFQAVYKFFVVSGPSDDFDLHQNIRFFPVIWQIYIPVWKVYINPATAAPWFNNTSCKMKICPWIV